MGHAWQYGTCMTFLSIQRVALTEVTWGCTLSNGPQGALMTCIRQNAQKLNPLTLLLIGGKELSAPRWEHCWYWERVAPLQVLVVGCWKMPELSTLGISPDLGKNIVESNAIVSLLWMPHPFASHLSKHSWTRLAKQKQSLQQMGRVPCFPWVWKVLILRRTGHSSLGDSVKIGSLNKLKISCNSAVCQQAFGLKSWLLTWKGLLHISSSVREILLAPVLIACCFSRRNRTRAIICKPLIFGKTSYWLWVENWVEPNS